MKKTNPPVAEGQDQQLKMLYKKLPDIRRFLTTLGCSRSEAEDIFQEALLIFVRKSEEPEFVLTVEPYFYVKNTCKLLWYNQSRKQQRQATFSLETDVEALEDDWFRKEAKIRVVENTLQRLGEQCQELLQLFYGLGWSMVDIAKKIGLRNDKVAKVQKYRCLQKAKDLLRDVAEKETEVESENLYL